MIPQSEFETNALASGKITYTVKMYHKSHLADTRYFLKCTEKHTCRTEYAK